ncbi:hypothetical protein DsansV1_C10g0101831 [Dioscorea sansibarensis]
MILRFLGISFGIGLTSLVLCVFIDESIQTFSTCLELILGLICGPKTSVQKDEFEGAAKSLLGFTGDSKMRALRDEIDAGLMISDGVKRRVRKDGMDTGSMISVTPFTNGTPSSWPVPPRRPFEKTTLLVVK